MSNKSKKTKKMRRAQKLENLKQEALNLKEEINKIKKENTKKICIKNLKIFGNVCNFLCPFVIVAGVSVCSVVAFRGGLPFKKDEITKYKRIALEYQSDGFINSEEHYEINDWLSTTLPKSEVKIYSPWSLTQDGNYSRTIRTYSTDKLINLNLYNAVLSQDIEYFSKNFSNYKEEIEFTNKKQVVNDSYIIKSNLHIIDKDDKLVLEESDIKNYNVTICELLATLGLGMLIAYKRNFRINDEIRYIKSGYKIKPIKLLKEELKMKEKKILSLTKGGKKNVR